MTERNKAVIAITYMILLTGGILIGRLAAPVHTRTYYRQVPVTVPFPVQATNSKLPCVAIGGIPNLDYNGLYCYTANLPNAVYEPNHG